MAKLYQGKTHDSYRHIVVPGPNWNDTIHALIKWQQVVYKTNTIRC